MRRRFRQPGGINDRAAAVDASATASAEDEQIGAVSAKPLSRGPLRRCAGLGRHFRRSAGLPLAIAGDMELAAFLHDLGKADRRHQAYCAGGDSLGPLGADMYEPLAKTGQRRLPRGAWERLGAGGIARSLAA